MKNGDLRRNQKHGNTFPGKTLILIILTILSHIPSKEFELSTPCGSHSYCSESTGEGACYCEEGFEEDATYAADRQGGAINGQCSRIDPCDSYDCSAVANSYCTTVDDEAKCGCDTNYETYLFDGSVYNVNSGAFFQSTDNVVCGAGSDRKLE